MCDIPNDITMDGNAGETPAMDTLEAEKVDAPQLKPSIEEGVQSNTVARASSAKSIHLASGEQVSCRKKDG